VLAWLRLPSARDEAMADFVKGTDMSDYSFTPEELGVIYQAQNANGNRFHVEHVEGKGFMFWLPHPDDEPDRPCFFAALPYDEARRMANSILAKLDN
jgi:hypothetical protein